MSCGSCKNAAPADDNICPTCGSSAECSCDDRVEICPNCGNKKGEKCSDGSCAR